MPAGRPGSAPRSFTDQLGRTVVVPFPPQRIISLVPSQTELLADLGLRGRVVGVTKFCVHPPEMRRRATVVGGTKQVNFAEVAALKPDLIIGNKEENDRATSEQLSEHYPLWLSDISDLPAALEMIRQVGLLTDTAAVASSLAHEIGASFGELNPSSIPQSAAYLIWRKPYMAAGRGTFIDDMLARAGFLNAFAHLSRYPEISPAQLAAAAPRHLFLSSEPYPFGEKHFAEFQPLCPAAQIRVVDGELFSWYGSRLRYSAAYLRTLAPLRKPDNNQPADGLVK